ncbi:MAG: hypothetical protein L6W00_27065 [Lentisphaeria bacterium]|nr:MAG: hypothetical protein L6W00_27065 [Lentisphaeria bacterium]
MLGKPGGDDDPAGLHSAVCASRDAVRRCRCGGISDAAHFRKLAIFLIAEGVKRAGKAKVPDNTPARPFLGLDEEQKIAMGDSIVAGIYNRFKAKNHENLLK